MKTGIRKGWSFRQKVLFTAFLIFASFLIVLAPLSHYLVQHMIKKASVENEISFKEEEDLIHELKVGLYIINSGFIVVFFIFIGWIFYRLTKPIRQISEAIRSFAEGQIDTLPKIEIETAISHEFDTFVHTLNSLSYKVEQQIRHVMDEKNEKESILDSLMEGVVALDGEGSVRYANQTFAKILGVSRRLMVGHPLKTLQTTKLELLVRCVKLIKVAQDQGVVVTDSLTVEERIFLDLIVVPKPFHSGAVVVIQDKSSQRQVVEMGKEFIANASHELRTPITIIKGFAETLQDLKTISPEMLAEITEKIVRNCERIESLIKSLLILADLDNIPLNRFQTCDLVLMAENCIHLLQTVFPTCQVELKKTGDHLMVDAEPDLLELALMNLLENGVKYSKAPAHLMIHLQEEHNDILIAIQDHGMGIPPADIPHIFERFYTVNKSHSRRLGGAGLGLSIVKTIIDKHEGTLSVTSNVGQGTTFTVALPKNHRWSVET